LSLVKDTTAIHNASKSTAPHHSRSRTHDYEHSAERNDGQCFKQVCFALGLNKIKERNPTFNKDAISFMEQVEKVPKTISRFNFHAFTKNDALLDQITTTEKRREEWTVKPFMNIHVRRASAYKVEKKVPRSLNTSALKQREGRMHDRSNSNHLLGISSNKTVYPFQFK